MGGGGGGGGSPCARAPQAGAVRGPKAGATSMNTEMEVKVLWGGRMEANPDQRDKGAGEGTGSRRPARGRLVEV
jgi:hypothetical protein